MQRPARLTARVAGALTGSAVSALCLLGLVAPVCAGAAPPPLRAPHPSAATLGAPPRGAPPSVASVLAHPVPDVERPAAGRGAGSAAALGAKASGTREGALVAPAVQSTNWSGEVALGSYTSITGSWTVPTLVPSVAPELVSTWIGIGGYSGTPSYPTLIQTGTVEITTGGAVADHAWVEFLPAPAMTLTLATTPDGSAADVVSSGDVMQASLTQVGPTIWRVVLSDTTRGWTYTRTLTYVVTDTSAEWVTERPVTGTSITTLADYQRTRFTGLEVASAGGNLAAPSSLTPVEMLATGNVVSAPGAPSTQTPTGGPGAAFEDHYVPLPARVYGTTDDGTAAAALEHQFPYASGSCPSSHAVVLATDATFPDALSSAYLAGALGTGTLLTPTASLSSTAAEAMRLEGITQVYVVGGPLAVSTAVVAALRSSQAYACGGTSLVHQTLTVTRIAGQTQYGTAEEIAQTAAAMSGVGTADLAAAYAGTNTTGGTGQYNATSGTGSPAPVTSGALPTAIVATGVSYQDAESASALAYADHLPVLLTEPGALSAQAASAIEALGIDQVVLMGGPLAVSDAVVADLVALPAARAVSVLRVAGADDTQTAVELARCETASAASGTGMGWAPSAGVVVARGDFYADGLAAALVPGDGPSGATPEPLLLTSSPSQPGPFLTAYLRERGPTGVGPQASALTILGGPLAVTQGAANTMAVALGT